MFQHRIAVVFILVVCLFPALMHPTSAAITPSACPVPTTPSYMGRVWIDTNTDGTVGEGEPVAKAMVVLYDNGTPFVTTLTDSNGCYTLTLTKSEGDWRISITALPSLNTASGLERLAVVPDGIEQEYNFRVDAPVALAYTQEMTNFFEQWKWPIAVMGFAMTGMGLLGVILGDYRSRQLATPLVMSGLLIATMGFAIPFAGSVVADTQVTIDGYLCAGHSPVVGGAYTGRVLLDSNQNRVADSDDTGQADVTVVLERVYGDEVAPLLSTETDENGCYTLPVPLTAQNEGDGVYYGITARFAPDQQERFTFVRLGGQSDAEAIPPIVQFTPTQSSVTFDPAEPIAAPYLVLLYSYSNSARQLMWIITGAVALVVIALVIIMRRR